MLIALPGVEAMGDDHLRRCVDRGLRVVTLDETVFGFQDAAFGGGEVLLRLWIRLCGRRGSLLSSFLAAFGFSLLLGFSLRFRLGRRGRLRLGLQFGLRRPDLLCALLLVCDPVWHFVAALIAPERLVFSRIRRFRGAT